MNFVVTAPLWGLPCCLCGKPTHPRGTHESLEEMLSDGERHPDNSIFYFK